MRKEEVLKFVEQANKSLLHFALAFMPEAFTDSFCPTIHYEMVRIIDAKDRRQKAVAAPRGCGKSVLGNTCNVLRLALMGYKKYILIVSATEEQAVDHLRAIKKQLQENERILACFGEQEGDIWREGEIVLKNGCKIKALGSGQQVRGRREGFARPDFALLDDFEDLESVTSETTLARRMAWWASDLRNSLDRHKGEELMLGTILSDRAILESQMNNPDCLSARLELFDAEYKTAWPEAYPQERIDEMRRQAEFEGKLDQLWADMRNLPVAGENQKFHREMFKEWSETDRERFWDMPRYMIIDPAKTVRSTSDYSAICTAALPIHGEVFLLDCEAERRVNEELYDKILQMAKAWQIRHIFIETNGLEDFVVQPLQNYLRRNGHMALVEGMHASNNKEDRIVTLLPLYKMGQIWHPPGKAGMLEEQLLRFPRSRYDDLMDCFSYVTKIMTKRNIGRHPDVTKVYQGNPNAWRRPAV